MTSNFFIYGLKDPFTHEIRYVGKTTQGLKRPRQHWKKCNLLGSSHKKHWIRQLLEMGATPEIVVLQKMLSAEGLYEAEKLWISKFRASGVALTNLTDGGPGTQGCKLPPRSLEFRRKASERKRGNKYRVGKVHSMETRNKMSQKAKGRTGRTGAVWTFESRVEASRKRGGRSFVDQFGCEYQVLNQAAQKLGVHPSCVLRVLKGRRLHVHGFIFNYK